MNKAILEKHVPFNQRAMREHALRVYAAWYDEHARVEGVPSNAYDMFVKYSRGGRGRVWTRGPWDVAEGIAMIVDAYDGEEGGPSTLFVMFRGELMKGKDDWDYVWVEHMIQHFDMGSSHIVRDREWENLPTAKGA